MGWGGCWLACCIHPGAVLAASEAHLIDLDKQAIRQGRPVFVDIPYQRGDA